MSALLLAMAVSIASVQGELNFEGPNGAVDTDLQKASKSLRARCEAYGYKGISASVTDDKGAKRIKLSCATGFTDRMTEAIEHLAEFPCSKLELRFRHLINKREAEQYQVGKTSPNGATWVELFDWEGFSSARTKSTADGGELHFSAKFFRKTGKPQVFLFKNSPVIQLSGEFLILPPIEGGTRVNAQGVTEFVPARDAALELSAEVTKKLRSMITKDPDDPSRDVMPVNLLIDGMRLPTPGLLNWKKKSLGAKKEIEVAQWNFQELEDKESILPLSLKNPLPFPLKLVK